MTTITVDAEYTEFLRWFDEHVHDYVSTEECIDAYKYIQKENNKNEQKESN